MNMKGDFMIIVISLIFLLILHGIFAVICAKEKKCLLPVFMAAVIFNGDYLKERIDFDRFIEMIHISNLIFSFAALVLAVLACFIF